MPGVFGVVEFGGISKEQLKARTQFAIQSLSHRGRNHTVWLSDCGKVAFAQCSNENLEIYRSHSGRSMMVLDGEILNHRELREQYPDLPAIKDDSRLLIELFEKLGSNALPLLEGAFACSIFDQSQRKVWLNVDHAGQKSLYVYQDKNRLIFASEIKAIKAFGEVDLEISVDALKEHLICGFIPNPRTIFKHINRLSPANFQVIDLLDGVRTPQKYWDLPILGPTLLDSSRELQAEFKRLLQNSVRKRLAGDQTVGVLLSGGIDSSAIAFEASHLGIQDKLKTFSLGFLRSSSAEVKDESHYSRLVAAKIHSDHRESQVDSAHAQFDQLLRHYDQPVSTSLFLPYSFLFEEAARYMNVGLVGHGADILFGGSGDLHMTLTIDEHLERVRFLLNWWPFKKLSDRTKAHIQFPLVQRLFSLYSIFSEKELKKFLVTQREIKFEEADKLDNLLEGVERSRKLVYATFHQFLCARILPLVDNISSINGLRLRLPYLDKSVIEFAVRLPQELRMDGRRTKSLIRMAYQEALGSEIADRVKPQEYFPLTDFLAQRVQGEDFSKIAKFGISTDGFQFQLKNANGQKKFLNLYALEGFLKHFESGRGGEDVVTFRNNLQAILSEVRGKPLEFFEPPADLKNDP